MAGAIPIERRPARPLPVTARGAILFGVAAMHAVAILLLLNGAGTIAPPAPDTTMAIFQVAPPPPPPSPPPDPEQQPDPRPAPIDAPAAARTAPPGGGRPAALAMTAPVFAPTERRSSFDTTLVETEAPPLTGAPVIGPIVDGAPYGVGRDGDGIGTGSGPGTGAGSGGGGTKWRRARWIYQPTNRDMLRYFPKAAYAANISGSVLLACTVPRPGRPDRCLVVAETPSGLGFGQAAIEMSEIFRIRPIGENDGHRADVPVMVPVAFEIRGKPAPKLPTCPPPWCFRVAGYRGEPVD